MSPFESPTGGAVGCDAAGFVVRASNRGRWDRGGKAREGPRARSVPFRNGTSGTTEGAGAAGAEEATRLSSGPAAAPGFGGGGVLPPPHGSPVPLAPLLREGRGGRPSFDSKPSPSGGGPDERGCLCKVLQTGARTANPTTAQSDGDALPSSPSGVRGGGSAARREGRPPEGWGRGKGDPSPLPFARLPLGAALVQEDHQQRDGATSGGGREGRVRPLDPLPFLPAIPECFG